MNDTTDPGRDAATELRLWLTTYTGSIVHRQDAQNLIDFLKQSGWKEPANVES